MGWSDATPWKRRQEQRRAEWLEVKRIAEAVLSGEMPDTAGRTLVIEYVRGEAGRVVRIGGDSNKGASDGN